MKKKSESKRRMVILSFDAVGARDLAILRQFPNFRKLAERGAVCEHVESVYPSITYPAHATIVTGRMPVHHGIINNTRIQPMREKPDWVSNRANIRGTTLYDEAIARGDRVCSLLWPTTGKSRIQYNIPEIHATRRWQHLAVKTVMDGSARYVLSMLPHARKELNGILEPQLDNFLEKAAVETILRRNPELMLVHFLDVDSHRHRLGLDHPEIRRALKRLDERIGNIVEALERTRAGFCHSMEDTTIVVLGDHSQMDCHTAVYPNYVLKEHRLLNQDSSGRITGYQAVAKNCDGSCYVYLHPEMKKNVEWTRKMTQKLTTVFQSLSDGENAMISHIFTAKEAGLMGADDTCVMMLEAKEGYYFLDDANMLTCPVEQVQAHRTYATHGYLPDLPGYQTFLLMAGYGVKKGAQGGPMKLWDEAPTFAKIMGISLPEADGRAQEDLLDL